MRADEQPIGGMAEPLYGFRNREEERSCRPSRLVWVSVSFAQLGEVPPGVAEDGQDAVKAWLEEQGPEVRKRASALRQVKLLEQLQQLKHEGYRSAALSAKKDAEVLPLSEVPEVGRTMVGALPGEAAPGAKRRVEIAKARPVGIMSMPGVSMRPSSKVDRLARGGTYGGPVG